MRYEDEEYHKHSNGERTKIVGKLNIVLEENRGSSYFLICCVALKTYSCSRTGGILAAAEPFFIPTIASYISSPRSSPCSSIHTNFNKERWPSPMETIHQLSIESFSHGWLSEKKASSDHPEDALRRSLDGDSFVDVDTELFSIRWSDSARFDFIPSNCDPHILVHADQIFFNGQLLPLHLIDPPKGAADSVSPDSVLTRSVSLDSSKTLLSQTDRWEDSASATSSPARVYFHSIPLPCGGHKLDLNKRGAKSPGKVLRKYLFFLLPLFRKLKSFKAMSSRAVRSCGDSPRSPWGRSSDLGENSIDEAVLHCKKSMGSSWGDA
ncbi:hypothetical protein HPP92_023968 [Vanilla planifolia]|uniref:Membrane-associated kinase regulator 6 n=1 Tax=Vanilla planifolia TaxID=51239 RepID=A0A835UCU8_VANPL|nr:hypothetical protein HPP92_023968 [Vanilla planifolia]